MAAERIIWAFQPLIDLIQGIAYPVTFVIMAVSFCLMFLGQKTQAVQLARTAMVGYILLQLLPGLMLLLRDVGRAMLAQ